ncbi:OmpH family outer membrane protein [Mariniflexile ostreae]|uniref:OmpH family outer membrane protein n=1 Tax=Mariniflexile ostreae TaxID=1520892 RepID=A0ABV5F9S6_9FLAO
MKSNVLFLLTIVLMLNLSLNAQRGVRIGYIDTEYILENVPEYQEASSQLESKVQKWKNEIELRLSEIAQKRKDLSNEKTLLTKELIDEREEDIDFEEKEILDYQQKRFGPNGDLMIQKKQLMQPIQDQVFSAVQDIAESRKYDFIFDKSSDAVMLYSAKQFDLSEQIIRSITRTSKRTQASSKSERRAAEAEDVVPEVNEEQEAREDALEDKREERAKAEEARRQEVLDAREAKKKEAEDRRQKILEERAQAREEKLEERKSPNETVVPEEKVIDEINDQDNTETKTRAQLIEENRLRKLQEREQRKKELEERKQNILEERQRVRDSLSNNK